MANQIIDKALSYLGDSLFKIVDYSYSYSISGDTFVHITADDFGVSTPSGYTPIAVLRAGSNGGNTLLSTFNGVATGTARVMTLKNTSSSTLTGTANLRILYCKSGIVGGGKTYSFIPCAYARVAA